MGVVLRVLVVAAVLVVPGGFLLLLAFLYGRRLWRARKETRQRGATLALKDLLASVSLRQVLREARATL